MSLSLEHFFAPLRARLPGARRVTVPTILQLEAVECGAACLAMILAYHGRWVALEELRRKCGVSRDGSTAANVLRAARTYGLIAEGYKRDVDTLREVRLPFVAFWNFNHFLVVTGFSQGRVYVSDPAFGRRKVTQEEFDKSFTGVILTFRPGAGFFRAGRPPSLMRAFRELLSGSWSAFNYLVLITALLVIPGIVIPAMMKSFVDKYLVLGLKDWLRPLLLAMTIATVLNTVMTWLQQRCLLRLQVSLSLSLGATLVRRLLELPAEFFYQRFAGDLNSRVQSVTRIASVLSGGLSANLVGVVSIILYGLVMASYSLDLTAIAIATAAISLSATWLVWTRRRDANRILLKAQGKLTAVATNGLQSIETIKAAGAERDLFDRWGGVQAQYVTLQQHIGAANTILAAVPSTLGTLGTNLVLCLGAFRVIRGQLTIGDLIAFQTLFGAFAGSVRGLVSLGTSLPQASGDIARIDDILCQEARPSGPAVATPAKLRGHLELRGVTFGYSPLAAPLIHDLSLTVRPGERVALVGRSGGGKSTVLRLVAGLFTPWAGEILLDGIPIERLDPLTRANSVSLVDQEIVMFAGSIRDNITLWDKSASDEDVIAAARYARIHEAIAARPGGFDGQIAEGAANFSGGERQRIEIARALALRPSLLLMDEATSALDPIVEKQIDDDIRRRGCGCLIAAHRLSTIRDCDEIIVMKAGKVVQRGTHESLLREDGEYGRLVAAQ